MSLDFIQNIALMIAGSVIAHALEQRLRLSKTMSAVVLGVMFGALAVVAMLRPALSVSGLLIDSRSVAIAIAGLFGGPLAAAISVAIAVSARIALGGSGALSGVITAVVVGLMASAYHAQRERRPWLYRLPSILLFGIVEHATVLAIIVLTVAAVDLTLASELALPMLGLFPLGMAVVAWFMLDYESQAESGRALEERESRFRTLFEGIRAPMLLIDPADGHIVDANPAAASFYGWSQEELRSMRIGQINTLSPEELRTEMQRVVEAKKIHFEFQHRRADGSVRDVDVYSGVVGVRERELLYSIVIDSTSRREAEREILERERLLRTVLETTRDGFCLLDPGGDIRMVNEAYAEMSGYEQAELISMHYTNLCAPAMQGTADEALRSVQCEDSIIFESVQRRRDGSLFDVEISATALPDDASIVCFIRDITMRRLSEKELENHRQNLEDLVELRTARLAATIAELRAANETTGQFLMNVSHELRTPLNSIIGFSEVLLREIPGPINADQEHQITTVRDAGKHLLSLINDILDLERIASGKIMLCTENVDLVDMAEHVCEELTQSADTDLRVEVVAPAGGVTITSDPVRVRQILINLIGNAVKFTERGAVTVSMDTADPTLVQVAVKDTGPGIPKEHINRVFEPFVQVHSATHGKPHGTGLGLTISQDLAALLGGTISVESRTGEGSTFTLSLPATNPACQICEQPS